MTVARNRRGAAGPLIQPTARLLALAALTPAAAVFLVLADERLWVAAAALSAATLLAALWDARTGLRPQALEVAVTPPPVLHVAGQIAAFQDAAAPQEQPEALTLTVSTTRRAPDPVISGLMDVGPTLAEPERLTFQLGPARRVRLEAPLTPLRRGEARVERLWLRWTGPLGLSWSTKIIDLDLTIPAIPDIRGVKRAALALDRRGAFYGVKPQSTGGDGAEFDALRDFAAGMDRRAVDWKRSAKHRKLLVKEFQAERNHNIILALDSGRLMREPLLGVPKLDHAVNAALIVAHQALAEGDRVGLFAFDGSVRLHRPAQPGKAAFAGVQKTLATLDYSLEETNFTLGLTRLSAELDRRSIIVLLTDFLDTVTAELMVETLARLAKRHLVLFAALQDPVLEDLAFGPPQDPAALARAVAAAGVARERRAVLARLKRSGVDAIDVAPGSLDSALLNQYLRAKRQAAAGAA